MRNKRDDLPDATKRILTALANHKSPYPLKRKALAKMAGMSRPTLDRYLPMLADSGYVSYEAREPGVLLTSKGLGEWRRIASEKSTPVDNPKDIIDSSPLTPEEIERGLEIAAQYERGE